MSRIVLTFKNNDKEKKIEKFLDSKLSPAGYIKELVWEVMNNQNHEISTKKDVILNDKKDNQDGSHEKDNDPAEGFNFDMED